MAWWSSFNLGLFTSILIEIEYLSLLGTCDCQPCTQEPVGKVSVILILHHLISLIGSVEQLVLEGPLLFIALLRSLFKQFVFNQMPTCVKFHFYRYTVCLFMYYMDTCVLYIKNKGFSCALPSPKNPSLPLELALHDSQQGGPSRPHPHPEFSFQSLCVLSDCWVPYRAFLQVDYSQ